MIAAVLVLVQQGSLFRDRIPHPTGGNGYEEFLQAVDLVASDKEVKAAYQALAASESLTTPQDVLAVRRAATQKMGPILRLMRTGAAKPVVFPPVPAEDGGIPGELLRAGRLARIMFTAAYVELADGNSSQATTDLIAPLVFLDALSRNVGSVGALVAVSSYQRFFALLAYSIDSFAPADLARLENVAGGMIERPIWNEVVRSDRVIALDSLEDVEKAAARNATPESAGYEDAPDSSEYMKMPASRRKAVFQKVTDILERQTQEHLSVANDEEGKWLDYDVEHSQEVVSPSTDLAHRLASTFERGVIGARLMAVTRTRWRLLRLEARLRRIMAEEDRVPTSLPDELPKGYTLDGLTGGQLVLRSSSTGFWVESKGLEATGVVTLASRLPESKEAAP